MKKIVKFFMLLSLILGFLDLRAGEFGTGLKPHTPEQEQYIKAHWRRIVGVRPNKIAAQRMHLDKAYLDNIASEVGVDELITVLGDEVPPKIPMHANALPSSVNNAQLPSFPPIGDQQQIGSCVGWASTYYHATHEIGLANGFNNKANFNHVLSPKWTYDLLNGGVDGGLYILDAYGMLPVNGAVSIVRFPYDTNYLAWDLSASDWLNAIFNRVTGPNMVTGVDSDQQDLTVIKQLLANGHVVTFGTWIYSYVNTTVGTDPSTSNPHAGEQAVSWVNGYGGPHHMTIVGYDDNIWIDVNGNGVVDPGEKGAFLIANQWGTGFGNNGFIWIAYDAFRPNSGVQNGPSQDRVPAANTLVSILPKAVHYSPQMVALFVLGQSHRNQFSVSGGVSDTTKTTPTKTLLDSALDNRGGALAFDGTTNPNPTTAQFVLDLTDFLPSSSATQRYYLSVTDNGESSEPTQVATFALFDLVHNTVSLNPDLPVSILNKSVAPYIDFSFNNNPPPAPPVVNITSPANNAVVQGNVNVIVSATSQIGIARVDLYVDSTFLGTDTTSPYTFNVDVTKLSNGNHSLTAVAVDTANTTISSSISVSVQNQVYLNSVHINAGSTSPVTCCDTTWQADQYFSGSYNTYSVNLPFTNPIYNTERYGIFSYTFPMANGAYIVGLKFAEIYNKSPGLRIFNVSINGNQVITNLDLVQAAGYGVVYNRYFPVTVTNNVIKIDFSPTKSWAKVSGISIVPQ